MSTQSSSNQISLHLSNPEKSLRFFPKEVTESENLFLDHLHGEVENAEDVQMADHLRPMEELLRIPIVGIEIAIVVPARRGNLMSKNTQETLTIIIENKAKVRTCRNKPQVSSSSGSSTQIDAITALTKQVEALISSMREAYNQNQEASIQLMQNQMGQMEETFQERPSCMPPSDTETYPREERKAVTTMSGLTLDGSFIPHSNFLVYQDQELEPETIKEVVEIASSKSTPLVPPPETLPLSTPKPKENLEPNPHQPLIPYPSRLKEEIFQALENPTGCADHFVYRIEIVDSLCDKFPIENNSLSGNPTPSSDSVVESLSPLPIPYEDSDSLVEETDILLSHFDDSSPEYETFSFDIEEKSSGSTTTHSDYSLSDYEAFYFDDDHIEEKSSGSTTTHSDFSLLKYDSFIFDLSIDPFPPTDRSVISIDLSLEKLSPDGPDPFTITEVYPYGTAKLSHADGSNFKVNCHRLKHYYGGDTPPLVIQDLQTFPKDN
ncbi:hypothetical protein Tco_0032916 [Tanacetum coccineum]